MSDSKVDELVAMRNVVRITTGSRLHFGLISTAAPFGGIGVMIDRPQTEIMIRPAESFQCSGGEDSERIMGIAQHIAQLHGELPKCEVNVVRRADPHSGLGSGTQLSMAVAEGLAGFCRLSITPEDIACRVADRGKRSAVGVHGYRHGGLIYEAAYDQSELNAIQQRVQIPSHWCVGLYRPADVSPAISGAVEKSRFRQLDPTPQSIQLQLTAIIDDQLIPSATNGDFAEFAHAVERYNYESGSLFQQVQGGPYNGPAVTKVVKSLTSRGAVGVGQSSWGPTVFAWFEEQAEAVAFQETLPEFVDCLGVCKLLNSPRTIDGQR